MSSKSWYNKKAATTNASGFGVNSSYSGGRFYKKNGSSNLTVKGVSFLKRSSVYNGMLKLSGLQFVLVILLFYVIVNILFAFIYLLVGIEHLGGISQKTIIGKFWEAFFFSAQTLSTVGYGHVYPDSLLANAISATESVIGLLALAIATGMIYGRFSQPRAYIRFSENALFAPFKEGTAIMFRLVPYKHNHLTEAEVKVSLVMRIEENGMVNNRFFNLHLEIDKINALTLSWTVVHPINEESPFYGITKADLIATQAELLVYLKAYDESYANTVVARTSYVADEFIDGGKFVRMYYPDDAHSSTILDLDKLDQFDTVTLPAIAQPIISTP